MNRWTHSNKATYNLGYHLVWCPKYRRKVLTETIQIRLKSIIYDISESLNCQVASLEIMPDHVHLFVRSSPLHAPHFIVQQFKGKSSRILRQEFPELKTKLPTLWTRAYFVESVGHISEDTIKKYIENQKNT